MHSTSATLLERLRQPDDAVAWKQFVYLYTPLIFYWASQLGLQAADALDLVQEVFLALYDALPEFYSDHQRTFRDWLFTLMRNKLQDWRRRRIPLPVGGIEAAHAHGAHAIGPATLEETEYRAYLSARALRLIQSEFTPMTWKTFWATVVEGRPAVDVAREFGVTVNEVYLTRGHVLRRLREALEGLLD